ncbi:MAG: TetR family transcriptional regulator [Actinomycetota bacterium]
MRSVDDRTTKSRIRDAAITCIAEHGVADTTARKVAAEAGVSAGLVIHHFGSMEGLREACDHFVATTIRSYKEDAIAGGPNIDVLAALRNADVGPLAAYLAEVLNEDSPTVARLVDELVADAEAYIEQGVEAGMVLPSSDPRGRAVVLTIWSLGALVLHRHLKRMLDVDPTSPGFGKDPSFAAYAGPLYEVYTDGFLAEPFATNLRRSIAEAQDLAQAPENEGTS